MEKVTQMTKMVQTERQGWFENSLTFFSPYYNVLTALFRNKKATFLVRIPKQVYAAMLEPSKNNNFFSDLLNIL